MRQDPMICAPCPYFKRGYVPGVGQSDASIMFVGEAPGMDESFRSHKPFTGHAGKEFDRFLKGIGIDREDCFITNLVKCNPTDNEDPKPEVIERCSYYLKKEIQLVAPEVLVVQGAVALNYFRPGEDISKVWGIPQRVDWNAPDPTPNPQWLFPLYHPALGLHQTRMLPMIEQGFKRLGLWLDGNPVWKEDEVQYDYRQGVFRDVYPTCDTAAALGVDTETTWDGKPLYVQVSWKEGMSVLINCKDEIDIILLRGCLESGEAITILHNAMFDLEVLHKLDIHPARVVDTMVMAYLLGDLPQGLKTLAYRLAGMEMHSYGEVLGDWGQLKAKGYMEVATGSFFEWPDPEQLLEFKDGLPHVKKPQNITKKIRRALNDYEKDTTLDLQARWRKMEGRDVVEKEMGPMPQADLRDIPEGEALTYACRDADATRRIYPVLKRRIKDEGMWGVLEMDMGIFPMLLAMSMNGITVDLEMIAVLGDTFQRKMDSLSHIIEGEVGYSINPGSSQQVAAMMDKEGITGKVKRGKSGAQSTGVEILEPLRQEYPVIGRVLDWRQAETLKSMFTDTLPGLVHSDGKVHTTFKTTRTITGRLATENPNLMAFPTRTEEGRMIRDAFEASPGYTLLSFDYEQIELRILAIASGDEAMLNAFLSGADLHTSTAAEMFMIPVEKVDKDKHRRPAKTVNFGIPYGITAMGLFATMQKEGATGWTEASCQDLIDRWFAVRLKVRDFMDEQKAHARRYGYVVDMFGRRRLTPEVHSSSKKIVEEGLRYAMNQPIQSGAQGVIKLAMGRIWTEMQEEIKGDIMRPLLQIHDDLLFECRDEDVPWIVPVIQGIMESTVQLTIPTPVSPKAGKRWGSMEDWKWWSLPT